MKGGVKMSETTQTGWILSSERLPEPEVVVETKCDHNDGMLCEDLYGKKFLIRRHEWVDPLTSIPQLYHPTHWRPLLKATEMSEQDVAESTRVAIKLLLDSAKDCDYKTISKGLVAVLLSYMSNEQLSEIRVDILAEVRNLHEENCND